MEIQGVFIAQQEAIRKISQLPRIMPIKRNMVRSNPLMEILQSQFQNVSVECGGLSPPYLTTSTVGE